MKYLVIEGKHLLHSVTHWQLKAGCELLECHLCRLGRHNMTQTLQQLTALAISDVKSKEYITLITSWNIITFLMSCLRNISLWLLHETLSHFWCHVWGIYHSDYFMKHCHISDVMSEEYITLITSWNIVTFLMSSLRNISLWLLHETLSHFWCHVWGIYHSDYFMKHCHISDVMSEEYITLITSRNIVTFLMSCLRNISLWLLHETLSHFWCHVWGIYHSDYFTKHCHISDVMSEEYITLITSWNIVTFLTSCLRNISLWLLHETLSHFWCQVWGIYHSDYFMKHCHISDVMSEEYITLITSWNIVTFLMSCLRNISLWLLHETLSHFWCHVWGIYHSDYFMKHCHISDVKSEEYITLITSWNIVTFLMSCLRNISLWLLHETLSHFWCHVWGIYHSDYFMKHCHISDVMSEEYITLITSWNIVTFLTSCLRNISLWLLHETLSHFWCQVWGIYHSDYFMKHCHISDVMSEEYITLITSWNIVTFLMSCLRNISLWLLHETLSHFWCQVWGIYHSDYFMKHCHISDVMSEEYITLITSWNIVTFLMSSLRNKSL